MAHLICRTHRQRVMVLSDETVIHRSTNDQCSTLFVQINGKGFSPALVVAKLEYVTLKGAKDYQKHMVAPVDLGELSQKFSEGLHKMTEQFKKMGAVISEGAKTIAVVLPNIMTPGEYRVIQTSESDPMAGLTLEKVPPVNLWNREEALLRAVFGKFEDVARDTTLGTAHITSTSEGLSADVEIKRPKIDAFLDEYRNEIVTDDHFPWP